MSITGFNLDLGITVAGLPAAVETDGAVALPYRLLAGLVSRFEGDEAITLADGALTASAGSYGLAALDAADYPAMPVVEAASAELAYPLVSAPAWQPPAPMPASRSSKAST